jgi:transposase
MSVCRCQFVDVGFSRHVAPNDAVCVLDGTALPRLAPRCQGPINAMTILAEAGDLRRFRHHRQFLKFCGMDLATMQSGMFGGQSRISKYGNARLRRTLWMAGQTAALKRTDSFRDKFERSISKDQHNAHLRRKAYTAIAAKMARTAHAVVKNGAPYRPFFEGVSPGGRTSL